MLPMHFPKQPLLQIKTLKHLPTLPHVLLKLIECCNDEKTTLRDIAKIVEKDPSLMVKILRLVNSSYYGINRTVSTIEESVILVGSEAIKNIAISASILEAFGKPKENGSFNLKFFWWHSLRCAVLARFLAKEAQYSKHDEVFLSALLHDVGKLVLWMNFPEKYEELSNIYKNEHALLHAVENQVGNSHAEIGAWFLQYWNFSSFMVDTILYHHEPVERINNALLLTKIIYVANVLAQEDIEKKEEGFIIAEKILGVSPSEIEGMLARSETEIQKIAEFLDIDIEVPEEPETIRIKNDLHKHDELVNEIRDLSLLLGTVQNLLGASDQDEILHVILQGLRILFDVKRVLFFLCDSEKKGLIVKTVDQNDAFYVIEDLIIPLDMEDSLFIKSLRQGKPLDSFTVSPHFGPVISDEQIMRFIGKDGIICLPLAVHGNYVGNIVIGLDEVEYYHLLKHYKLLVQYTSQVTLPLYADQVRRNQLKIVEAERLSASSYAIRKTLHEVNNPLTIIKNYLKILGVKLFEQNIAQDEIRIINEEIDRVSHIIGELGACSKERISKDENLNVNDLLSNLSKILEGSLLHASGIKLHLDLETSLPVVRADKDELKQVFINLIKNAVEAMPGGGNIYIQTRRIRNLPGERVQIMIRDEGVGILDKIKPRIFEPFVTSKSGDNPGLGLFIVHNIIESFKSTITCESKQGEGTTFKIEMPAVHD